MPRSLLRRALAAVGAATLAIGATGCGDDDAQPAADSPIEEPAGDPADDAAGGEDPGAVTITALDYHYEGVPERVPAGTTFELVNEAPGEVHEAVVFRLPDGEDRPIDELLADDLGVVLGAGPPTMVLVAPPGEPGFAAEGDGTLTEPGRYALVCMIPTGADPDEFLAAAAESEGPPDVEGGPPHISHGMYAAVVVE